MQTKYWQTLAEGTGLMRSKDNHTNVFSRFNLLNMDNAGRAFFRAFSAAHAFFRVNLCHNTSHNYYGLQWTNFLATAAGHTVWLVYNSFTPLFYWVHRASPTFSGFIVAGVLKNYRDKITKSKYRAAQVHQFAKFRWNEPTKNFSLKCSAFWMLCKIYFFTIKSAALFSTASFILIYYKKATALPKKFCEPPFCVFPLNFLFVVCKAFACCWQNRKIYFFPTSCSLNFAGKLTCPNNSTLKCFFTDCLFSIKNLVSSPGTLRF